MNMSDTEMLKGIVFNIQRFSIHDGPGIRTVVFMKGCPLNCAWCSNPESQNPDAELFYSHTKCIGCLECVKICPTQCLSYDKTHKIGIDKKKCILCFECVRVCPTTAMSKKGLEMEVDTVMTEILKDREIYKISNGGVTLSGGEVFGQFDFSLSLLKRLKQENIHTAIETTGYTTWERLEKASKYCDLVLFDFKHDDNRKHLKWTGVSNVKIKHNLERLLASTPHVIVRIPIVPGFNDDSISVQEMTQALLELKVGEVELLRFHQFGKSKYKSIFREYQFNDCPEGDEKQFNKIIQQYKDAGINVINLID